MVLSDLFNGSYLRVIRFEDGKGLEDQLWQLGILPGDTGRVLRQAPFGGPVLLEIHGRTIALGRGVASKVIVDEIEQDHPCDSP
jgi:ferrous iron transport protein A